MVLGLISIEKSMLFAVKHILSYQCVGKGKVLTVKSIDFSMKIGPKITCELCRKFLFFLFYVGNVFVDTGECGELMGTFQGSYKLEKLSEITRHFAKSITIGFPIQMNIC